MLKRSGAGFQVFFRDPIIGIEVEPNSAAEPAKRAGRTPTLAKADAPRGGPPTVEPAPRRR
jgi:hypothetical protein